MSKELAQPQKRKARISPRIKRALDLMAKGSLQVDAAARVQISPEHLSRMLGRADVRELLDQRTRDMLLKGKLRAAARSLELLEASSEHVAADMTKWHLGVHGIKPSETPTTIVNNTNMIAGYIVDLGEYGPAPVVDVTPESSS